jgi:putative ABC transport system permease protein
MFPCRSQPFRACDNTGSMLSDLRFSLRTFRRSRGLIAAAILATALGVGANTAIFSVMDAMLLRPLPYRDPGRLVMVWEKNPAFGGFLAQRLPVALRNYVEWKRQSHSFSGMAAVSQLDLAMTGMGQPEELAVAKATPDFFPLLGVSTVIGRPFGADESVAGKDQVAVLSYKFFARRFAGDPHTVGRSITLGGGNYTVIGVLPQAFHLPAKFQGLEVPRPDVWLPLSLAGVETSDSRNSYIYARLASGVTLEQARSEMTIIGRRTEAQFPKLDTGFNTSVFPLSVEDLSPETSRTVVALQVAVGFVLLIACANVANLLLARAAGRGREMAIRTALGASRTRLMRQILAESLLLSVSGGALGVVLAAGVMEVMNSLAPEDNYHFHEVGLNWTVLAFAAGVAIVSGIVFGLAPAVGSGWANVRDTLSQDGRAGIGRGSRRLRNTLVVAEVSLALVLLAGAGLMIRSLRNVLGLDPGFNAAHVLTMHVPLPDDRYPKEEQVRRFCDQLLDRVSHLGGVESVSISSGLPLMDNLNVTTFRVEGRPPVKDGPEPETDRKAVSEDYFRTIRTPLLRGRGFTHQDATAEQPKVVVINDALARQIFPNGDALDHVLGFGDPVKGEHLTIVGIVPDTHEMGLDTPSRPEAFVPTREIENIALMVRTAGDPMALSQAVSAQVWAIDKDEPVRDIKTLEEQLHGATGQRRFDTMLFASFAGLALLLAAVGLYGVLSYSVVLRTREIGVRMALGAQPGSVVRLILANGLAMTLAGVAIGAAGAFALTQWMSSLIFQVSASDPLTFAGVAVVLVLVAVLASYIPARRASRLNPIEALRES